MVHARPAASRTPPRASKAASPRFRLWNHLRRDRRPRSLGEIYAAVAIEPEHMFSLLDDWSGRGLLLTQVNPVRFLMTEAARAQGLPPRANNNVPKFSGRQRLWAAMRVLKTFDLQTICMASETSHKGAVEFLRALGRTGYVTPTPPRYCAWSGASSATPAPNIPSCATARMAPARSSRSRIATTGAATAT